MRIGPRTEWSSSPTNAAAAPVTVERVATVTAGILNEHLPGIAPGERLLVHAGHVGVFEPSVGFDIQMVKGFKIILFGGEGLFLATLTGPGHIWLQSMPILNLAEEIGRYLPFL